MSDQHNTKVAQLRAHLAQRGCDLPVDDGARHGLVSGCYPLDDRHAQLSERAKLMAVYEGLS